MSIFGVVMDYQDVVLQENLMLDRPELGFVSCCTIEPCLSENYSGKWLIMFSSPTDFTLVCTSEFIGLQRSINEFKRRDHRLLGLSVASIYSNVVWVTNIKEKFGEKITLPIIKGVSMSIAILRALCTSLLTSGHTIDISKRTEKPFNTEISRSQRNGEYGPFTSVSYIQ